MFTVPAYFTRGLAGYLWVASRMEPRAVGAIRGKRARDTVPNPSSKSSSRIKAWGKHGIDTYLQVLEGDNAALVQQRPASNLKKPGQRY
jgi:hypothetical protein